MEKTFVDFYLLGYYDKVVEYKQVQLQTKLNALEQCFLIDALLKKGQEKDARAVLALMKLNNNLNSDVTTQNKIFDIVLNMNNLKNEEGFQGKTIS